MHVFLANPRGFCAGVDRAVSIVDELLDTVDQPIYVRHAIVHNHFVVEQLERRGAIFVEDVDEIPEGSIAVMSAHGVSRAVLERARERTLRVIDATCPLVSKVQLEVLRQTGKGRTVIVIGHRGHVEVDGLVGHRDPSRGGVVVIETREEAETVEVPRPDAVAYVTQTTLAVEATREIVDVLRRRFPALAEPHGSTICYATQNRQDAVIQLARRCQVIVVIGAPHSSNSRRLVEVAEETGARGVLIERASDLTTELFASARHVGVTSSASAPETLIEEVVAWLTEHLPVAKVYDIGERETISFRPPASLRALQRG
ncbi:MAG: ispH [Alphaproteobacteria bacterium]|nr:ispH [Alphaproteobacteria bacterium]MDB5722906.1 ispH [Alphaproteobacteria bacterium]